MNRTKTMFFAFTGKPIEQSDKILEIQEGYECWDLKKFTLDDFIKKLQKKIPPVNENVQRNYKAQEGTKGGYGLTEKHYNQLSWGLLIPDTLEEGGFSYIETLYLLNLYSPNFLYPVFYANDMGIMRQSYKADPIIHYHTQNHAPFQTKEFVVFYKLLLEQSAYGNWHLYRIQSWNEEDWRLFVASFLYTGLTDYENGKNPFEWQRESAEMATILEALFTAGDAQNEEVMYRLRKRIAVLLSWKLPDVEKDIKDLYKARSAFVHGAFFKQIAKESPDAYNSIPSPDFDILYKQKEYVRLALVTYINLARTLKLNPASFKGETSVMAALEKAIIDIELREMITAETKNLFALMPKVNFKRF